MDKYITVRYPQPATILDYFEQPIYILEEPASLREAERAAQFRRDEEFKSLLEDGVLCAGLDTLYAAPGWMLAQAAAYPTLCAENFARSMPDLRLTEIVNAPAHTLPAWSGEVATLADEDLAPLVPAELCGHGVGRHRACRQGPGTGPAGQGLFRHRTAGHSPRPGTGAGAAGHLSSGCEYPFAKYASSPPVPSASPPPPSAKRPDGTKMPCPA